MKQPTRREFIQASGAALAAFGTSGAPARRSASNRLTLRKRTSASSRLP